MRRFYSICLAAEGRTGNALLCEAYDLAGFNSETIKAWKPGTPVPGYDGLVLHTATKLGALPQPTILWVAGSPGPAPEGNVIDNPLSWHVVAGDLAGRLLEVGGDDLELLPVEVRDVEERPVKKQFYVINALRMLDALWDKKTRWLADTLSDKETRWLTEGLALKLAIYESKVPDNTHIFRVKRQENKLLVDDVMKRAICSVPHDGLGFIPIEQG